MKAVFLAAVALATPAVAQAPARPRPQMIAISMTDHGFVPRRIVLRRDGVYALQVTNRSGKGHNLTQKAFFANARIDPADRGWVQDGQIVLDSGRRATVRLRAPVTRPGGAYQFSSTVLGDADNDYTGEFVMR